MQEGETVAGAEVAQSRDRSMGCILVRDAGGRHHVIGRVEQFEVVRGLDTWATGRPFFSPIASARWSGRVEVALWSPFAVAIRRRLREERHASRARARRARAVRRLAARQRKRARRAHGRG